MNPTEEGLAVTVKIRGARDEVRQSVPQRVDLAMGSTHRDDSSSQRWTWRECLLLLPPLLVVLAGAGVAIAGLILRLLAPCPINPWEAGFAVEAYRFTHHLPVFTPPALDHATGMYGPLHVIWLALGTEVLGRHLWALRAVSLAAASAMALLGAWLVGDRLPVLVRLACAGLLLSISFPCFAYFTDPRPDAMALLLELGAMTLLYVGQPREGGARRGAWVLGLLLLLAAVFTKQTAAMFAPAPLLAMLMGPRSEWRRSFPWAAAPLAVVLAALVAVRIAFPSVSHYMLEVPALPVFRVVPGQVWPMAVSLVGLMPIAFLGLAATCARGAGTGEVLDRRSRWLLAAFALSLPLSILTAAHGGGARNSLLPALAAGYLLTIHALSQSAGFWSWRGGIPVRQLAVSLGAGLLLAAFFFSDVRSNWGWSTGHWFGDESYETVIAAVAKLPGRVLSPSDPSITLRAFVRKGVGRSMIFELDESGWHGYPEYVNEYLRQADWIVRVKTMWGDNCNERTLGALGFEEVTEWPERTNVYSLWKKVR